MILLNHTSGKQVWYNPKTGLYYDQPTMKLPETLCGKYAYFETYEAFMESDTKIGYVPMYCNTIKSKGKRKEYSLTTRNREVKFWNVELVKKDWKKNNVEDICSGRAYLVLLVKDLLFINDCRIKSVIALCK
jgi:hypothetical protein